MFRTRGSCKYIHVCKASQKNVPSVIATIESNRLHSFYVYRNTVSQIHVTDNYFVQHGSLSVSCLEFLWELIQKCLAPRNQIEERPSFDEILSELDLLISGRSSPSKISRMIDKFIIIV